MDDYDYESYDPSGYSGLDFSSASDTAPSSDGGGFLGLDFSGDMGDETFNPDEYLASQGNYTPPSDPGVWGNLSQAFMRNLTKNPAQTLAMLGGLGGGLYSTIQGNKQRAAQMKSMQDAKAARDAKLARYGAVLPLQMNRTYNQDQGNLLTAGMRPGGVNWFSPTTFTPMAEGGAVAPQQGWLSRVLSSFASKRPDTSLVGSGSAAAAGDAVKRREYDLYRQSQEIEGDQALPYDQWYQLQQPGQQKAGGGGLSLVEGHGGGQDDLVPIKASPGEYIFSAQDVSDIGDGDNSEGARRLDEMRQKLRAHKKRSTELAPKAKSPETYLKKGG